MKGSPPSRLSRILAHFTSPGDVLLAARVMTWACALPLLKRVLPIRSLVKLVWREPRMEHDTARDQRVIAFARFACRLTRWRSGGNCLERGLLAYRFLLEGHAEATLVVGIGKDHSSNIIGHAWVLLNDAPAGESAASVSEYVPVFAFGPDGSLIRTAANPADSSALSPTVR